VIEIPAEAKDDAAPPMRKSIEPPAPAPGRRVEAGSHDWTLSIAESACPIGALACAAFSENGEEIVVLGQDALARCRGGRWTALPMRIAPVTVLALVPWAGAYLALTSAGPLLRLGPSGGFTPWGVTLDRYVFHGATPLPGVESLMLVGATRDRSRGVVAKLDGESLTVISDTLEVKPLRAVTHLPGGGLLAATEDGSIVVLRGDKIAEGVRPANVTLLAARVVGDEIVVVGAGAWAFRVTTAPLTAALEPVDTLSALTCLAVAGEHAWAGTDKGRILRRQDHHWRRMNPSFEGDPAVLGVHAEADRMSAVLADGRVVLGVRA
jgi:hypothetical protein